VRFLWKEGDEDVKKKENKEEFSLFSLTRRTKERKNERINYAIRITLS